MHWVQNIKHQNWVYDLHCKIHVLEEKNVFDQINNLYFFDLFGVVGNACDISINWVIELSSRCALNTKTKVNLSSPPCRSSTSKPIESIDRGFTLTFSTSIEQKSIETTRLVCLWEWMVMGRDEAKAGQNYRIPIQI